MVFDKLIITTVINYQQLNHTRVLDNTPINRGDSGSIIVLSVIICVKDLCKNNYDSIDRKKTRNESGF